MLWLLAIVPVLFVVRHVQHDAHNLLFVLSILCIIPLGALLSRATEAIAAKTGDTVGGLLNATLGNLTELIIAITALRAGQYLMVKASIAGVLITKILFLLGVSFLLGGLKYRIQEYNQNTARLQSVMLFLATIALLVPTMLPEQTAAAAKQGMLQSLSVGFSILLIGTYALSMLFSLKTHKDIFTSLGQGDDGHASWPTGLAIGCLLFVTVLVALVSEVFVEAVEHAASSFGMSEIFVGFIVIALVSGAAEMIAAFAAARKNRLDISVGIALGGASQVALFVAPLLVLLSFFIGPSPMDLQFWPGAVFIMCIAAATSYMVTSGGRSTWFVGTLLILVYLIFALTLYLLPTGR